MSEAGPAAATQVAVPAIPAVPRSRVGYVPARANRVRDGLAVALLVIATLLPWSIEFGVGVPGSSALVFVALVVVTLLSIGAALAPYVGPWALSAQKANARRTATVRYWLNAPYFFCVLGFIVFHLVQTVRDGGTGMVPPGAGPGMWLGIAGALLAAQPVLTSKTLEHNDFDGWYTAARFIGVGSIALAALSVVFNLVWRLRYLFVTEGDIGGQDVAVVVTTLLYGGVAMVALVIGSLWLVQKTAAARLATTALGVSAALAGTLVWLVGVGRDVDAFHGIAENTSTAAVGYEGYLAWAAAAAIVAPTTLYAVFLIKPPTLAVYRGAALKCLTLIAFWSFAAAGLRVTDYLIAVSLDLPHRIYDSFALTAFNVVTGCVALWLKRQLAKGGLTSTVIAAFAGVLSVFTAAQLVIGVALAPRYADPVPRSPDAIYGNDLAQQLTSTFDVVVCVLSLAILVAALVTGPLAGYVLRRRETRAAAPKASAPPTIVFAPPQQKTVPRIVRLKEDSTRVLAEAAPTATLRIQRRPVASQDPLGTVAWPVEPGAAEPKS
ncbi:MAG: hypothetical protein QOJ80_4445 [Mycobacterium sp.]|nr:hypothetical protein [Mycobacterium sp.]